MPKDVPTAAQEIALLFRTAAAEHAAGRAAAAKSIEHYYRAGEALVVARFRCKRVGRGEWTRELERWCESSGCSRARAYHYVALAELLYDTTLPPDVIEAEWRRISGNAPPTEDEPAEPVPGPGGGPTEPTDPSDPDPADPKPKPTPDAPPAPKPPPGDDDRRLIQLPPVWVNRTGAVIFERRVRDLKAAGVSDLHLLYCGILLLWKQRRGDDGD